MAQIRDLVLDSHHPASLARFWAEALDGYQVAAYDDVELERLRNLGVDDPEDDPSVLVEPASGVGLRLFLQRVPEARTVKNRLHLDLAVARATLEEELDRLVRLGATVLSQGPDWLVLADPEGNEFCLEPT